MKNLIELKEIQGGPFLMGSPKGERDRCREEGPQRLVTVPPFFMGRYPVTQTQWRVVADLPKAELDLDPDPSYFKGDGRPVERVSWHDAQEFCARLSAATAREYRLPSEAEWEFACRAGTTTPFYFGESLTEDLANFNRSETTPVGSYLPNDWGLYDMHGNVWEWCVDHWHSSYEGAPVDGGAWVDEIGADYRVLRGGSWIDNPWLCRSAYRDDASPDLRYSDVGFRVVCSAPVALL